MDFDEIGNRIANLTMYDVKQLYTAAKNYALNISEIEAKVNEATSDDPWGASSTLMQEIAAATQNFQDFNEIMPAIYRNFMEREAREWRQIYKALQLLEYIIKHGSERVVDDARSHLGTIKILRNFHYIDDAGKDQGINVRNRAKEIAELLGDVERIRMERRKARQNKTKYQGAGNTDFVPGSGTGRYGGFGSDSLYAGGASTGTYGVGANSGRASTARDSFDAYDAGEDEDDAAGHSNSRPTAPAKKKEQAKVADLFSFDDEESEQQLASASTSTGKAPAVDPLDDFDDFQAAPSAAMPASAPPKQSTINNGGANVFDFLGDDDAKPQAQSGPLGSTTLQPSRTSSSSTVPLAPSVQSAPLAPKPANSAAKSNASLNFDDLWASSAGKASTANTANKGKLSMAEMAKQKSSSAVWGAGQAQQQQAKAKDPFDFL